MSQPEMVLNEWQQKQELAEKMQPMIGRLYREEGVILRMYGRVIINQSTVEIIKAHRLARQFGEADLKVQDTFQVLDALSKLDLGAARIDLGKLTAAYKAEGGDLNNFLTERLAGVIGSDDHALAQPQDIVLYGFGRIGRLLARMLIERTGGGQKLRLKAIVVRKGKGNDLQKRASLLRRDSVHGPFSGTIRVDEENNAIIANGNYIRVIYASNPAEIDYTTYGIDNALIVDNTGVWRDEAGLSQHLKAKGAAKVLLTAPGKGDLKNVVYGVNHDAIGADDKIISAASCTTNAITPVLKVLNDEYGIERGHVETVHSYTNDQNLIDNYHSAERRGRSAALNMVITETGAAKAVSKALPVLEGKLTGNAIRVPTPNVSMAIINVTLKNNTTREQVNSLLREEAIRGELQDQIDYTTSTELVSTDLVGSNHAGVIDSQATIANDNNAILYVWYDNEYGYSVQVVRCMQAMAGVKYPKIDY